MRKNKAHPKCEIDRATINLSHSGASLYHESQAESKSKQLSGLNRRMPVVIIELEGDDTLHYHQRAPVM